MYEYHVVAASLLDGEPLAYSMAPRTAPTLVSRFTNSRPPEQNGIAPTLASPTWQSIDTIPVRCAWFGSGLNAGGGDAVRTS
jgi:hypothetical protein